jgi:hypothetical protein
MRAEKLLVRHLTWSNNSYFFEWVIHTTSWLVQASETEGQTSSSMESTTRDMVMGHFPRWRYSLLTKDRICLILYI